MTKQDDIRTDITNQIIDSLTNGKILPWRRPWKCNRNAGMATSLSSGDRYRGVNQIILQVAAMRHGYQSKWWATYKQIQASGGQVIKGEKGTKIVLWKPIERKTVSQNGEENKESYFIMRQFTVFNVEQTEGLDRFQVSGDPQPTDTFERYERAEELIRSTDADIRYGGSSAYYSLGGDYIQCPPVGQFESPAGYYETIFHELVHWTEPRLNWERQKYGYEMGELIAELGACFLMGELEIPFAENISNHAAYLDGWLKKMKGDPKFIFDASSQASKAVDYLLSYSEQLASTT
ncbi:DNA primase TraC [Polystyrenella longa]|uniref:DNA primase TraC n=1 Tax=Polystyrenella longa TaxID=2528007 RepID=A0A518CMM9_9PLAN|nr:ArdC-like ssDNA-binding domain-containing protein [Polystyrenella longa]QDU80480.1 DNA primase TraC [Polystyrenella longa]